MTTYTNSSYFIFRFMNLTEKSFTDITMQANMHIHNHKCSCVMKELSNSLYEILMVKYKVPDDIWDIVIKEKDYLQWKTYFSELHINIYIGSKFMLADIDANNMEEELRYVYSYTCGFNDYEQRSALSVKELEDAAIKDKIFLYNTGQVKSLFYNMYENELTKILNRKPVKSLDISPIMFVLSEANMCRSYMIRFDNDKPDCRKKCWMIVRQNKDYLGKKYVYDVEIFSVSTATKNAKISHKYKTTTLTDADELPIKLFFDQQGYKLEKSFHEDVYKTIGFEKVSIPVVPFMNKLWFDNQSKYKKIMCDLLYQDYSTISLVRKGELLTVMEIIYSIKKH
jgi:hypothetical protein